MVGEAAGLSQFSQVNLQSSAILMLSAQFFIIVISFSFLRFLHFLPSLSFLKISASLYLLNVNFALFRSTQDIVGEDVVGEDVVSEEFVSSLEIIVPDEILEARGPVKIIVAETFEFPPVS